MSFLNPWFFAGTLAVSVPILLHLIKRERSRRIEFPSLMYLRRVSKKVIRFQKIRHLLLLLLRIAAFLLLALAFTRPFRNLPQLAAASGRAATTAHVILLDNSMSMAYGDRWDRARKAAADIAASAKTGDRVALVEFSDRVTALTQVGDASAVRTQLAGSSIEISDRPTRYGQALKAAERMALETTVDRRVIHLISDFQRSGSGADEANFRLAGSVALEPVSVASPSYSNLTFGDVTVRDSDDAASGGALKIKASVVNFGTEDRRSVGVHLRLDGRGVQDRTVDVPKAGLQAVEFDLPGLTSGPHALVLEVDDANLASDNRFSMMIESRGKTPVFSVETPASGRRSESFFLAPALNVSSLSPYRLMDVSPQRLEGQGTLTTGIVVWSGPPVAGAVQRVHDYVRGGGGLVAALGGQVRGADWNRTFGTWLPVQLDESPPAAGRRPAVDYALLTDLRMEHPIFRPFSEPHSGSFSTAKFFNHHRLKVGPGAEILARFDNGDAALVAAQVDRGRVLVWASSADDSWNDLPLKSVFAPFWQQMLRYVDNYKENRRWLEVGETIAPQSLLAESALRQGKGGLGAGQAIVLLDPAKKRIPLQASSAVAVVERTGFYEVRSSGLNTSVAVNPVARESDLAPGDPAEMVAGWISHEAQAAAAAGIGDRPPDEDQERRAGFWRFLLLAVLVFLLSEGMLANRLVVKPE